jgi:hypothetical protein
VERVAAAGWVRLMRRPWWTIVVLVSVAIAGRVLGIDELSGEAKRALDLGDPDQRALTVAATIEASLGLLRPAERVLFAELAVFAEDETVPVDLIGRLWQATAGVDALAARALCARLADLALVSISDVDAAGWSACTTSCVTTRQPNSAPTDLPNCTRCC